MQQSQTRAMTDFPSAGALTVSGVVRNARTLTPLEGVVVQVYYVEPALEGAKGRPRTLLGSAVAGSAGMFLITWLPGAGIAAKLCLIANCPEAEWFVSVRPESDAASWLDQPVPAGRSATRQLDLQVPLPVVKMPRARWNELAKRAQQAGLDTLNALVAQLTSVSGLGAVFSDWSVLQRQAAVADLESAFLDPENVLGKIKPLPSWQTLSSPDGLKGYVDSLGRAGTTARVQKTLSDLDRKLDAFSDLSQVDWPIKTNSLGRDRGAAITAYQGNYAGILPTHRILPFRLNRDIGYRDYLRSQWINAITAVVYVQPHQLTVAQAESQLRNRFHQDFETIDTATQSPNEILIPILTEILTSPPGNTFGFGKAAASIPARSGATARDYLDTLIALTGLSVSELSLRYRTDFSRPDSESSSAVWENIHTLQGFFRDSFQSIVDPSHTDPDVLNQPIIPDQVMGRAPFFLEYDEWLLLQQPVPYENYVQIRNVFHMDLSAEARTILQGFASTSGPFQSQAKFHVGALGVNDDLQKAFAFIDQNEFRAAIDLLTDIWPRVGSLIQDPNVDLNAVVAAFADRRKKTIGSMEDLYFPVDAFGTPGLLTMWQDRGFSYDGNPSDNEIPDYFGFYTPKLGCALVYLYYFGMPTLLGQASLALGDYAKAVRLLGRAAWLLIGAGELAMGAGWSPYWAQSFKLYVAGELPYTVQTATLTHYPSFDDDDSKYFGAGSYGTLVTDGLLPGGPHAVERAYFRLQMGEAMLAWADTLYRTNDASSISRARELYKGVFFLHGTTPPIDPAWGKGGVFPYFPFYVNPAKASQLARAQLGFQQIEAGLNFFGYADDMVPIQRYGTLIASANAFAADAKAAETDFINAMSQIETATIDNMKNAAMLKRAQLGIQIAQQQAAIANDQVTQANVLIAQVNDQIAKAKKDIEDHDSLFGQFGDYLSGMIKIAKGAKDVGDAASAGKSALDNPAISEALGLSGDGSGAALAIPGGATIVGAYGAFFAASYITLSGMSDAATQRDKTLQNLIGQNLVAANAQLDIAKHQVTIAQLQQQISQADADLAASLLNFAQERFLNIEFWTHMAQLFQRAMRRYVDYGARAGWLAQRALSYEENTNLNIVGFDYYPAQYMGAGGADELQLDLASLQAQYVAGLQEMVPLKVSYSLARDFPLALAQLQAGGACQFQTTDAPLQAAYPGMYGFRVRAVTPRVVRSNTGAPMRGVLANSGVSAISIGDGTLKGSTRPADALPISDFDISTLDMNVFGLPGATLMQFEGSGIETVWTLNLPPRANPGGLGAVGDVVLTFDLTARFSPALFQSSTGSALTPSTKTVLVSASRLGLAGLDDLKTKSSVDFVFDFAALDLPDIEKSRTLNNLYVLLPGMAEGSTLKLTLLIKKPAKSIKATATDGVAFSNAPPITDPASTVTLSPLNVLQGVDANQAFTVHVDKASNPGVDLTAIRDVLLGIDYTAGY